MALETATFLNGLVASNPTSADQVRQGDDHLRLIKATLKNTFPNLTGAMNATQAELNHVVGVTSAIQTQLNNLSSKDSDQDTVINSKQATITGAASTITSANLATSRALISDASGKVVVSPVTSAELAHLDGVTSPIQTQLNSKYVAQTQATSVWETGTGTSETLISPVKLAAAIQALETPNFGVNQTWRSYAEGSGPDQRDCSSAGTRIYQNTEDRAIAVRLRCNGITAVSPDGVTGWEEMGADGYTTDFFIVPSGHYYRNDGSVFVHWREMRI